MMTSSNGNIFRVAGPLCGEFTGHLWIPRTQRPVTQSFLVFFDLRLNERLSKQSWGCWFETPTRPLWRQRNDPGHFLWKDPQATKRHWWWITTGSCNGFVLPGNKTLRWPMFIKLYDAIWWRHQMETFFALLALCEGNPPVTGGFPSQKPVSLMFSLISAWINGWANNQDSDDLRRHRAYYGSLTKRSWNWSLLCHSLDIFITLRRGSICCLTNVCSHELCPSQ